MRNEAQTFNLILKSVTDWTKNAVRKCRSRSTLNTPLLNTSVEDSVIDRVARNSRQKIFACRNFLSVTAE